MRRPKWNADDVIESSPTGRRGPGTVNHCIHGRDAIVEEILDYRPYDYWTVRSQFPIPGTPKVAYSQVLEDRPDGGTHVDFRIGKPRPRDREAFLAMAPTLQGALDHMFAAILPLLEAEAEARRTGDGVEVPAGQGRFATEPVTA